MRTLFSLLARSLGRDWERERVVQALVEEIARLQARLNSLEAQVKRNFDPVTGR